MQSRAVTYSGRDFCLSLILASGSDLFVPQHLLKNRTLVTKHLLLYQAHYNFIRAELLGHSSMSPLHFGKGINFLHGGKRAEIKPKSCLSWMSMTT